MCGQRQPPNDPRNDQNHSPNTPTTGLRERGNDTSGSTGRSGRQNAATRRNMRRDERVTVQGPGKEQEPDGMSHGGGGEGGGGCCSPEGSSAPSFYPRDIPQPMPSVPRPGARPRIPHGGRRTPVPGEAAQGSAGRTAKGHGPARLPHTSRAAASRRACQRGGTVSGQGVGPDRGDGRGGGWPAHRPAPDRPRTWRLEGPGAVGSGGPAAGGGGGGSLPRPRLRCSNSPPKASDKGRRPRLRTPAPTSRRRPKPRRPNCTCTSRPTRRSTPRPLCTPRAPHRSSPPRCIPRCRPSGPPELRCAPSPPLRLSRAASRRQCPVPPPPSPPAMY